MKLFKAPAAAPFFVAHDVWAARAPAGEVAAGFVGLRLGPDGAVYQMAPAGGTLEAGKPAHGAVLWWVRTLPWSLRFAPEPELAPEAGLVLEIEPQASAGDYHFLAAWLARQLTDVRGDAFAALLRQHPQVRTLPPCVTHAMLAERALQLRAYAVGQFGVCVLSVRRVDLPPPAEGLPAPVSADPQIVGIKALEQSASGKNEPSWDSLVSSDRRACRRLAAELPLLDLKLRKRWGVQGWSDDVETYVVQRGLRQRLALLAGKFGQPASLEQRFAPGRGPTDAQRHVVAAAALRAEQALGQAWAAVEALAPEAIPSATELAVLGAAVDRLEHEASRRLGAWWGLDI